MGCAQSREVTLRKADLATADGGMKAVECVVGMPLAARTGYVLKRRRRFLGGYFEIKDHTDTVVFKCMPANNWFALHGQMTLQDAKGNNVCVFEKKILSMPIIGATTFWVYKYQPAFEGQTSDEQDKSGAPLYRFAVIDMPACSCPQIYNYSLYTSSDYTKPSPMLIGEGAFAGAGVKMLVCRTDTGSEVAAIGQSTPPIVFGSLPDVYAVDVSAGTDPVGIMCLTLAAEQLQVMQQSNDG